MFIPQIRHICWASILERRTQGHYHRAVGRWGASCRAPGGPNPTGETGTHRDRRATPPSDPPGRDPAARVPRAPPSDPASPRGVYRGTRAAYQRDSPGEATHHHRHGAPARTVLPNKRAFWLNLQNRYDIEVEWDRLGPALDAIQPLASRWATAAAFHLRRGWPGASAFETPPPRGSAGRKRTAR